MPTTQDAVGVLRSLPYSRDTLTTTDFTLSGGEPGRESVIAELQPQRLITLRAGAFDLDVAAYESFPSDTTSGDTDEFDLSHYPIETDSVAEDLVLYAGGEKVSRSDFSVDFEAGTLSYTGGETTDDLHAFYSSAQQARYEVRKVATNGTPETIDEGDLSLVLRQDSNTNPLEIQPDHALQGVIPAYYKLQIRVDAPYPVRWTVTAGDGEASADQMLAQFPINRSDRDAPDWLSNVVGAAAGAH
jgi:hypothetical protein